MTLRELINEGLIKDEDRIVIKQSVAGTPRQIAEGKWNECSVADYMDSEIYSITYTKGKGWFVNLNRQEALNGAGEF